MRSAVTWQWKAIEILRRLPVDVWRLDLVFEDGRQRVYTFRDGGMQQVGIVVDRWLDEAPADFAVEHGVALCLAALNPNAVGLLKGV